MTSIQVLSISISNKKVRKQIFKCILTPNIWFKFLIFVYLNINLSFDTKCFRFSKLDVFVSLTLSVESSKKPIGVLFLFHLLLDLMRRFVMIAIDHFSIDMYVRLYLVKSSYWIRSHEKLGSFDGLYSTSCT